MLNPQIISKVKFEFESLFWTNIKYSAKVNMQNYGRFVDIYLISYRFNDRTIKGIIIEPKDKTKRYPVIIQGRGGNNVNPEVNDMSVDILQLGRGNLLMLAAKHGYVIYGSQLSGYGSDSGKDEFGGEDINDILALKELIDQNPICDSSRIGMLGFSRGGMMAYLALIKAGWLKTIAVVGSPTDWIKDRVLRPDFTSVFKSIFGDTDEGRKERSILYHTDKIPAGSNILILQGKLDDRNHFSQAEDLAKKLKELNINHKLILIEGGDHGLTNHKEERDQEILDWFNKYL